MEVNAAILEPCYGPHRRWYGLSIRQAITEEISLKDQQQRQRAHIKYKTMACGEKWQESAVYELRAISGKDSMRGHEFQQLFLDIRYGRVNTILCPAFDRGLPISVRLLSSL